MGGRADAERIGNEQLYVAADLYSPNARNREPLPERAAKYYQQARDACAQGDVGLALRLASRAATADPNHVDARRVLGYRRIEGHWAGNYAARRLEQGEIWHSQFGWIQATDASRWEAGERPFGKRWISATDDARRHQTIDRGWQIRTDHFRVVTNHSREAAAQLATRLERLYRLWQQLLGGFFIDADDLLARFDGKESSSYRRKPFRVVYYRTRDEYNAALRRQQPRIGMTLGIYFDTTRTTHFFAGDQQDAGTINHEAVHQFFHESTRSARDVGALSNAWLMEGIACYFESLVEHRDGELGPYFTIGTLDAGRLLAARHRRLVDDYYVPLAELSALGMTDLQRRDDIAPLYSQSAGLTTFLMHDQRGRYRAALIDSLRLIYAGRDKNSTLAEQTGESFLELDRQYVSYLQQLTPPIAARPNSR